MMIGSAVLEAVRRESYQTRLSDKNRHCTSSPRSEGVTSRRERSGAGYYER